MSVYDARWSNIKNWRKVFTKGSGIHAKLGISRKRNKYRSGFSQQISTIRLTNKDVKQINTYIAQIIDCHYGHVKYIQINRLAKDLVYKIATKMGLSLTMRGELTIEGPLLNPIATLNGEVIGDYLHDREFGRGYKTNDAYTVPTIYPMMLLLAWKKGSLSLTRDIIRYIGENFLN